MSKPSHLISAKLTTEAFEIYNRYKAKRRGGHAISNALLLLDQDNSRVKELKDYENELRTEIRHLREGIRNLQAVIKRTFMERDELADELRDLFTPAFPSHSLENVETDLDSESC